MGGKLNVNEAFAKQFFNVLQFDEMTKVFLGWSFEYESAT